MNKDQFLGKWKELKGKVKEKWGKLTDDDVTQINGKWEQLSGKLQKKYGWNKEQAEREMNEWCSSCEHRGMHYDKSELEKENEAHRGSQFRDQGEKEEERRNYNSEQSWGRTDRNEEEMNREDWRQRGEGEGKRFGKDENKDKKRKAG